MTHKRFLAGFQVSMLFLKFCIDGIPVGFWQPTEDDNMRCPRMTQVCHRLQKDGNLLPLLLQVTFVSPTICNCLFHIFGLSMLSNVVQETVVTMALNIRKKNTASIRTGQTSQPSLQDEAPFEACFFQIGPTGTAQLLPRFGRNLRALGKVQLLQGRVPQDFQQVRGPIGTGACVEAPGAIKKGTMGIYQPPWEDGISKKLRLCHASPNPPKTSPLCGVGPIII